MDERTKQKQLWTASNVQGGALLIYRLIMNLAVFLVVFVIAMLGAMTMVFAAAFDAFIHNGKTGDISPDFMEKIVETAMNNMGWGYLAAVAIGLLILLLWKKPRWFAEICSPGEKMKPGVLLAAICMMLFAQFFVQIFVVLGDALLSNFGISITEFLEENTASTDSLSMFLYITIAAPISEEILFRGLVMRSLQPHGKQFAIFTSSLLFALFHGNPIQIPFAFLMGLLLGYLAQRYHIGWAVLLHMLNNLVLGDLLPRLLEQLPYEWGDLLFWLLLIAGSVGAVIYALRHRDSLKRLWNEEPLQNWQLKAFFTSPCILILMGLCTMDALMVVALLLI